MLLFILQSLLTVYELMKQIFIFLASCLIFWSFTTEDPIKLTVKDILASTQKERRFVNSQKSIDFLTDLNFHTPLLKDLGFRYGADDISSAKQQFALGVGFNSLGMMKKQDALKKAQINRYQSKKEVLTAEVIKERYVDIVDVYFAQTLLAKQQFLDTLLNQRNAAFKLALQKGLTVKIKDLVETEEDLRQLNSDIIETQNIRSSGFYRIKDYLGLQNEFVFSFDNVISVAQIKNIVQQIKGNKTFLTPEIKSLQNDIGLVQAELSLEEASFNQILDGVQLIYEKAPKNDFTIKDFAFRVSFNIPIKGNLRPKQNELLMDIKEAENDYHFMYFETDRKVKMQLMKLDNMLKQYQQSVEKMQKSLAKSFLNTPSVSSTLSPTDIIDLKIIEQKKEIDLVQTQFSLLKEFIALLDLTGDLVKIPYKNYLSNNLENW